MQNKREDELLNKKVSEFFYMLEEEIVRFFPPEWLPIQNRIQNGLSFQHLFVLFQSLFSRGWAELHCTFIILARLLTTGGFVTPGYCYNCHWCENKQRDLSISELSVWALMVISSQSWANALLFFNNGGSAAVIGSHWLARSHWILTITLHKNDTLLSNG